MAPPTRDDAMLMVQLAQWGAAIGLEDAVAQTHSNDFDPDSADAMQDKAVRTILMFGESIGTLTRNNLLSVELVRDWLWVEGLWSRVAPAAMRDRERFGNPRLYENFEALATGGGA